MVDDMGAGQKAARAFGIMGFMFHTVALFLVVLLEFFMIWRKGILWNVVRGLTIASGVCSILVFSAFAGDCDQNGIKCVPGPSGIIGIFNIFVLIAAVTVCFLTSAPVHPIYSITKWNGGTPPLTSTHHEGSNKTTAGEKSPQEAVVPVPAPTVDEPTTNSHTDADA